MIVIPCRLTSSRFPNKVLKDVLGLPMVIRTAQSVSNIDDVIIACDSKEIQNIARKYKIDSILTSQNHQNGTTRINEAANLLKLKDDDIIINVQADEPFIEKSIVKKLIDQTNKNINKKDIMINSCYKKISLKESLDPNFVKVILNTENHAIYFSRSQIPFNANNKSIEYYGHLGIYGFSKITLNNFCNLKPCLLENIEKLEQLRAIEYGYKIAMIEVESKSFGIDTPNDLENAIKIFS